MRDRQREDAQIAGLRKLIRGFEILGQAQVAKRLSDVLEVIYELQSELAAYEFLHLEERLRALRALTEVPQGQDQ